MAFFALLAYLFFVFIRPQEFIPFLLGVPVVKVSLIIACIFMLAEKKRRFDAPQNLFLFLFIPVILMSGITNGWAMGGVYSLQIYLTSIFLPFLVIQNIIVTIRKQQVVMMFLLCCALIMVHNGWTQVNNTSGIGWSGTGLSQKTRITYLGIFNDPNDLGMFLVMVIPFSLYFFHLSKKWAKPFFICATGLLLYGIYLTNSRGALLGSLSLLGLWFYKKYGLKKSMLFGTVLGPVMIVIMSAFREIDSEESSAEGRLDAWYEGFQMLFWKPFLGVGMGNFTEHHHLTAHNSFVLIFSELGFLGYFLWIGFITVSMFMLLNMTNKSYMTEKTSEYNEPEVLITKVLLFSLAGYLVTCFFLSRSYIPLLYIFGSMILASYYRVTVHLNRKKRVLFVAGDYFGKTFVVSIGTISLIYVMVRFLL